MMPSATTQTMKPKIGFSIESIVGVRSRSSDSFCEESEDATNNFMPNSPKLPTSASLNNFNDEYSQLIKRARRCVSPSFLQNNNNNNNDNERDSSADRDKLNNNSDKSINNIKRQHSQSRSPSPVPQHHQKPPIHVPGIHIPGLIRPQHLPAHYPSEIPHGHNPHLLAQFQALANVQAAQVGFNGHLPQHFPPHLHNPNLPRESYQLYPWLLSRHGRLFPHRFPGNFLLQPFRKPKRVRTAFSPTQLLKLEHAFEGNHYVVGAERKTLAQQLSLTETQVKVWFQNRRTKHKRTQQEDGDDDKSGNKSSGSPRHYEEDELEGEIDVDEYPSDDDCGDNDA